VEEYRNKHGATKEQMNLKNEVCKMKKIFKKRKDMEAVNNRKKDAVEKEKRKDVTAR
jgi:hypothetical protein